MQPETSSDYQYGTQTTVHEQSQLEHSPTPSFEFLKATRPRPVVKVLSPMGVEYVFLTLTLFIGASALIGTLLTLVNGRAGFAVLAFPASALVVTVPVFSTLFLHLKKLELRNPDLRLDASKRHTTQLTQIVAFIVSLVTVILFVFAVFSKLGGQSKLSIGKAALDALCVLVVASGILAYYWRDEHRNR